MVAELPVNKLQIPEPHHEPTDSGWYLTSGPELPLNPLSGSVECDCLIIGAGWMGLHAARRYAELNPDARVLLVDAGRIGNNASGRCMGFAIDLAHNPRKHDFVEDLKGNQDEFHVNSEGNDYLKSAVEMGVECDWDPQGKYHTAATEHGVKDLMMFSKALDQMGQKYTWVDHDELKELTGSSHYLKALHHPGTILIHPAKYLKNAAKLLPDNVSIHENTVIRTVQYGKSFHRFETINAEIKARKVIICASGYLTKFGFYQNTAIPVYTFASMTRELTSDELALTGHGAYGLIPANSFGTTVRKTSDNRLILRNVYTYAKNFKAPLAFVEDARRYQQVSFDRRWPELSKMGFISSWGGLLTLAQNGGMVWGELAPNVYGAAFCNGTGVSRGTAFGKAIAELASGKDTKSIRILQGKTAACRAYPECITSFGVKFVTGRRLKEAGLEI